MADFIVLPGIRRALRKLPGRYHFEAEHRTLTVTSSDNDILVHDDRSASLLMMAQQVLVRATTDGEGGLVDLRASLHVGEQDRHEFFTLHGDENSLGLSTVLMHLKLAHVFASAHPEGVLPPVGTLDL